MANVFDAMKKHQAEEAQNPSAVLAGGTVDKGAAAGEAPKAVQPTVAKDERLWVGESSPVTGDGYAPVLVAHHDRSGMIAEQFRAIRTSLMACYPDNRFSVIMTSAEAEEGKTVTALNLAIVLAERQDRTTIVVDCDLRRRQVATLLQGRTRPGVTDYLRGTSSLSDIIQRTVYPNLFFIASGEAKRTEVSELVSHPKLDELVSELRRQFDCILIDSPPVNSLSDPGILGRTTGEALIVVRMNKTNRESVDRAIRLLHAANIKVSGMILTGQQYLIPSYLYRYS